MATKSYNQIRESSKLVSCGYKMAGKHQLFVEHYLDNFYNREYFVLFSAQPNSLFPLTINTNEL